ncbi:stage 0 sporulation family protein [Natroniella sp. ANB-PHB2]|uniref:PSP1 domain-containing protein n=1 Tax=Natroniella sp. ANB-PHB2 TaxID=3384444 RepID=UPI0038D3BA25
MAEAVGVIFKKAGKIYYFKNDEQSELNVGQQVVVKTVRGIELGEVVTDFKEIDESKLNSPLKSIIRKATLSDIQKAEENEKEAEEAFDICLKKIEEHGLPMKLIDAEYTLDKKKLLFYFTADGRVDFRELVKDLAAIFRTRIELRQIGVRDEAKMLGGLGPCGRQLCCKTFLRNFEPISIKMAKKQDLSLNPSKISGVCGRLMCCLRYEAKNYLKTKKNLPNIGEKVETKIGKGRVKGLNVVKETVTVELGNNEEFEVDAADIQLKDCKKKK